MTRWLLLGALCVALSGMAHAQGAGQTDGGGVLRYDAPASPQLRLQIEYPPPQAAVADSGCGLFVAGHAMTNARQLPRYDVVIVIDTSSSTRRASGADVNGNGIVGADPGTRGPAIPASSDPGDSIVAAEVAAARRLLRELDRRLTRVGVVTFAGAEPGSVPIGPVHGHTAVTRQALTHDYASVESALDRVLEVEAIGGTDMAAGVERGTSELLGRPGALSAGDLESRKILLFFTDGQPTLPHGPEFPAENVRAVLEAASYARLVGVRIYSFAIGPEALEGPIAALEMATRTEGAFIPVREPGDVIQLVEEVSFANVEDVSVRSATTGEWAHPFRATADGAWAGFVRLVPGVNEIEVVARAADGHEARESVRVRAAPGAPTPEVPLAFGFQRNQLLEECLRAVKVLRLSAEAERAIRVRKELRMEIERERLAARERADAQRKQLEIEVGAGADGARRPAAP